MGRPNSKLNFSFEKAGQLLPAAIWDAKASPVKLESRFVPWDLSDYYSWYRRYRHRQASLGFKVFFSQSTMACRIKNASKTKKSTSCFIVSTCIKHKQCCLVLACGMLKGIKISIYFCTFKLRGRMTDIHVIFNCFLAQNGLFIYLEIPTFSI